MTYILVINAGSSSLKYQLIDIDKENYCKRICERIASRNRRSATSRQTANHLKKKAQ
jgi:acetate kinase